MFDVSYCLKSLQNFSKKIQSMYDNQERENISSTEKQIISKPLNGFSEVGTQTHHLLDRRWTLWEDRNTVSTSAEDYAGNLKQIHTIDSVEEFWNMYVNMPKAVASRCEYSYYLMVEGSKPIWEDPMHQNGGAWYFKVFHDHSKQVWIELLLALIGEVLNSSVESDDKVLGVSMTIRSRIDVFQVWTKKANVPCQDLMQKVVKLLPNVPFKTVFFKAHQDHRAYNPQPKMKIRADDPDPMKI